jgi:hypothetical protein
MTTPTNALLQTPAVIRKIGLDLWREKEKLAVMRLRKGFLEAEMAARVSRERDEKGGKVHSNAEERDHAARSHLKASNEYQGLMAEIREQELMVARIETTLRYHEDLQRKARALVVREAPARLPMERQFGEATDG